ncbi:hypothetical protein MNBD_CHLOROFLEXI01-527 [hydrothermal vent metagenome]|uniref:Uncharacterized protein n=1 Tax=hydrothermal vent metagenome TaxID=652676 RepID=A0A3B0V1P1_9ZZZZ
MSKNHNHVQPQPQLVKSYLREELVPDFALFESWYQIDEKGMYSKAISLVTSAFHR